MEMLLGLLEFCRDCQGKIDVDGEPAFRCPKLNLLMVKIRGENRWVFLTNFSETDLVSLVKKELERFS